MTRERAWTKEERMRQRLVGLLVEQMIESA